MTALRKYSDLNERKTWETEKVQKKTSPNLKFNFNFAQNYIKLC